MRKHVLAGPALIALLAGSPVGVTAQDEAGSAGLVTEHVEPGVERIIRDDAGHDLDEKHPTYRYDMDGVTITPDGTVWLATTYSRSDNEANPPGPLVWALGQPGTLTIDAPPAGPVSFFELSDGTLLLMAWGAPVATLDGDSTWTMLDEARPRGGDDICRTQGVGVTCADASGDETTYLAGTPINQVAVAPDGTVWAVGGYAGDNGGLYRITVDWPSPSPTPPAVSQEVWPGFRLLSSEEAKVSIQVPHGWGRAVYVPEGFDLILQAGSGNTGLAVSTPRDASDLESTVDAMLADPTVAEWQPYTRTDLMHGSHRAVRLDSRARADGAYIGGSILYIVERSGDRPVLVSLAWDSVTDLGDVGEVILIPFNPDGASPAVLASYPAASTSFVTLTDAGCSAAGPHLAATEGASGLTVENQTGHVADLDLLRVGYDYGELSTRAQAAATAIAAGRDQTWVDSLTGMDISDIRLQPRSQGRLTARMLPGTYAVMCFLVDDHDEPLGVYLTLPFEVE